MKSAILLPVVILFAGFINNSSFLFQNKKDDPFVSSSLNKYRKTIFVSTVSELYNEVNKTANEGQTIVLARGTYTLNIANSPSTMGRLELQKNMTLQGSSMYNPKSKTWKSVIDGSMLPPNSFDIVETGGPKRTGFIRMGRGKNVLTQLTIKGNPSTNALSAVDTDLQVAGEVAAEVQIDHTTIINSQTGIDIRNAGKRCNNRVLTATITDNEFRSNRVGAGQGMTIQNSVQVEKGSIRATLKDNFFHLNVTALRVMNQGVNSGKIDISSHNDKFEWNETALLIWGGMDNSPFDKPARADNNAVSFTGDATHIWHNSGTKATQGAIYVVGGFALNNPGTTSDNTVKLTFTKPDFYFNAYNDIFGFGARYNTGAGIIIKSGPVKKFLPAGERNTVLIEICPKPPKIKVKLTNSDHVVMGETNMAALIKCISPK